MTNLIYRIRLAYHFLRRLGPSWIPHVWAMSGATLGAELDSSVFYGEPMQHPKDAVDEELSCWSD